MKVMVIVKASRASEAGEMPSTEMLTAMGDYNEQLVNAGIMVDGAGLTPSSRGARVRFSGTQRIVTDGPFAETKELIAGYWVWNVSSLQEAIDWVKKCPNPMPEDSEMEIRPYVEMEDFGEAFTPELREKEASLRAVELRLKPPRFEDLPETKIAGINQTYTMENRHTIPQQWERFVPLADSIPNMQGKSFYGVAWNILPKGAFDYLTGVEVPKDQALTKPMESVQLAQGRYAVFIHSGHVSTLPQTIDTIWTQWAPNCGLKMASTPCFELYTAEFNPNTGMGGMEMWIPIAP